MRAQPQRLAALGIARREGVYVAAPLAQELQRQMSQATDADDPDAIRLLHAELHHRIEHGDAGAKRRSGSFETERLRQRQGKGPIATDPIEFFKLCLDMGLSLTTAEGVMRSVKQIR